MPSKPASLCELNGPISCTKPPKRNSEIELDDLIEPLSELFNTPELIRDYENVWEWIQGNSTEFKSNINVSREHDWEKGKFDKPLILTFDYRGLNKNKTIEKIGRILAEYFEREVNFGTIHILSNDEYEQKIEQIFKPTEKEVKLYQFGKRN